jgi:hypothetical protein
MRTKCRGISRGVLNIDKLLGDLIALPILLALFMIFRLVDWIM